MKILRNKFARAFTLLEVMVAIALLCLIVTAIYSSWNSILKGSRVALDAAADAQRTRITMRTLQDSLLCSCMFIGMNGSISNYMFEVDDSDSDFSALSFTARLPRSFPRSGKFGDLSVRRLQFTVEKSGGTSGNKLVLRQRPLICDFTKDEAEHPLVLARDVVKFLVEFIDPKTGDWVTEWNATNSLPKEARITLALGHLDQYSQQAQEEHIVVLAMPSTNVPPQLQAPGAPTGGGGAGGANAGNGKMNGLPNGSAVTPPR